MSFSGRGLAHVIAAHLLHLRDRARQRDAVEQAKRCLVDFFAVSLAARYESTATSVIEMVAETGETGNATVLCSGARTSAPLAALVNGTVAHTLDFDDTLWSYIGHPTAVVLPAACALAEGCTCSGKELLEAFTLGVEAAHLIGKSVPAALCARGFHPTPIVGTVAAAAAAALVSNEDTAGITRAMTLATNMASGLRQNFGSSAKPIVAGWAAHAGIMAALMAQQGLTGSESALEGPQGFYQATSSQAVAIEAIESDELALISPGVGLKLYPCCTGTHPAIDAMLSITREFDHTSERVRSVEVTVTPEVLGELIYPLPLNAAQARFSLPYCTAIVFQKAQVELDHFREPFSVDPEVIEFMKRIRVRSDSSLERTGGSNCPAARAIVTTDTGRQYESCIGAARGNPSNPATNEELDRKFHRCAGVGGLAPSAAQAVLSDLRCFQDIPSIGQWVSSRLVPLLS